MDDIELLSSQSVTLAHRAALSLFQFSFISGVSKDDLQFVFASRFLNTLLESPSKQYAFAAIEMYVVEIEFVSSHIALRAYSPDNDEQFESKSKKALSNLIRSETYDGMISRHMKALEGFEKTAFKSSQSREKIAERLDDLASSLNNHSPEAFSGVLEDHMKERLEKKRADMEKRRHQNFSGFI